LLVSCALAEVKRNAAISQSAMTDFQRFLLMKFASVIVMFEDSMLLFRFFASA
jgi:hypothetical protein